MTRTQFVGRFVAVPMVLGFLVACSDSPKQYPYQAPPNISGKPNPGRQGPGLEIPSPEPGEAATDEDSVVLRNTKQPLQWGVSAAGISFSTEMLEAHTILSKPDYGPDVDGYASYKEGVDIIWRTQEPRTMEQIFVTTNYLGPIEIGGEFGTWRMGEELGRYFTGEGADKAFIVKLYRVLENEPDVDCLQARLCQIQGESDPSQKNLFFRFPRGVFMISKDRKALNLMSMFYVPAQGRVHVPLDLVQGVFDIPASEDAPAARIQLGQAWKDILAINGEDAPSGVNTNGITKSYDGVVLGLTKSDYSRDYKKEPKETETLKMVAVFGQYNELILVNGRLIEMTVAEGGAVGLKLTEGRQPEEGKSYVKVKMDIPSAQQVQFLRDFQSLLKSELEKSIGPVVQERLEGLNKPITLKSYRGNVAALNPTTKEGRNIAFGFSEEQKSFTFLRVETLSAPSDQRIAAAAGQPLVAKSVEQKPEDLALAGFKLGERVDLSDIDLGRDEATVRLTNVSTVESGESTTTAVEVRAAYNEKAMVELSYDGETRVAEVRETVSFGSLPVSLGLKPVAVNEDGQKEYALTSITTTAVPAVSNLCQLDLTVKIGESTRKVQDRIFGAIAEARKQNAQFKCRVMRAEDDNDLKRLTSLILPEQSLRLNFSENELVSVTIYANPAEVK